MKKQLLLMISCLGLLLTPVVSQAGLVLTLNDNAGHIKVITDGGVGDMDHDVGQVKWFGSLGSWIFNFTAGLSTLDPASLTLTSLNATSSRGGNLTITLTDDRYVGPIGASLGATTSFGGITSGNVTLQALYQGIGAGTSTSLTGGVIATSGPSFSGTRTASVVDTTGGFSLKQIATITHRGAGVTGLSMITTVPEPATLGLLGIGLIGLAFVRRRQIGY